MSVFRVVSGRGRSHIRHWRIVPDWLSFWTKDYANRDEETWAFEDEGEYRVDEHGIGYSLDGHRLLFARAEFKAEEYHVPEGVVTICSMAFASCRQFVKLHIPRSVRLIGDFVFGTGGGKIVIRD